MRDILKYKNLFIEKDEMESSDRTSHYDFLKIFHNCDPGCERLKVKFFDHFNDQYLDDYIVIQQESFNAIHLVFHDIVVGFDEYSSVNPLKGYGMMVAEIKCNEIIEDLKLGILTDKLKHYLNHISAELLDESVERLTWHTPDGNVHRDDEKHWKIIFQHREKIINFYSAFFYFVFEIMRCNTDSFDDLFLINISGY